MIARKMQYDAEGTSRDRNQLRMQAMGQEGMQSSRTAVSIYPNKVKSQREPGQEKTMACYAGLGQGRHKVYEVKEKMGWEI